jgi:hypothetical protein
MDEDRIVIGHGQPTLSKEQKVGLSFVVLCGLGAMILGGLYLWRHVASPFSISYTGPQLLLRAEEKSAKEELEKKTDTDGDQISDYDEKNVYGTSPYIADTDSDGVSDSMEITNGQDPNCAKGKTCDSILQDENAFRDAGTSGTFVDVEAPVEPQMPSELGGNDTSPSVEAAKNGLLDPEAIAKLQNLSTAEVRALLISSGADPDSVAALSEDDVRALYQELLQQISDASAEASASATTNP